jgi:hypothetical protein
MNEAKCGEVSWAECQVYIFQHPSGWLYLQFWIYIGGLKPLIDPRRFGNQLTCLLSPNIHPHLAVATYLFTLPHPLLTLNYSTAGSQYLNSSTFNLFPGKDEGDFFIRFD